LLRYLFVLRVNTSLVWLPSYPALEFSWVLGSLVAERLPTQEARPWRKVLALWSNRKAERWLAEAVEMGATAGANETSEPEDAPAARWPIDAVLHIYPNKRCYGQGELILWELKLFGDSADHRLFLEQLLPAVEAASFLRDRPWARQTRLWGNFDIAAVYVARGLQWQPLVQDGVIDLKTRPNPMQWRQGLPFTSTYGRRTLTWVTPFDFGAEKVAAGAPAPHRSGRNQRRRPSAPDLAFLLDAAVGRLESYVPGWLEESGNAGWTQLRDEARKVPLVRSDLRPVPRQWPGQGIGPQTFRRIPAAAVPYLTLASILHIGRHIHFGCGAFALTT
jgi:hypothetical protein